MTEQERQALRDFIAREVMGWERVYADGIPMWKLSGGRWDMINYRPDSPDAPMSLLLRVIDAMRKRRFKVVISWDEVFQACFISPKGNRYYHNAATLPDAVLLAAKAALEGENE